MWQGKLLVMAFSPVMEQIDPPASLRVMTVRVPHLPHGWCPTAIVLVKDFSQPATESSPNDTPCSTIG